MSNYNQIVQDIQAICEDDGSEFVSYIPTAIRLAEDRCFKYLDILELQQTIQGTLTEGVYLLNLPNRFSFNSNFILERQDGSRKILKPRSPDFLDEYWPNNNTFGEPKYYSRIGQQFRVTPPCDGFYNYSLLCTIQPTYLSNLNLTNFFTDNCYDILLGLGVVEGYKFLKSLNQAKVWEDSTMALAETWNIEQQQKRRDGTETPRNPSSTPNTKRDNR